MSFSSFTSPIIILVADTCFHSYVFAHCCVKCGGIQAQVIISSSMVVKAVLQRMQVLHLVYTQFNLQGITEAKFQQIYMFGYIGRCLFIFPIHMYPHGRCHIHWYEYIKLHVA